MTLDPLLVLTTQYFVAVLFLMAGLHKYANLGRVGDVIAAYRVVPAGLHTAAAWLVIGIELIIAVALVVPPTSRMASLAAATVFVVYFSVMGLRLFRGDRKVDCGCSFHPSGASLSSGHLIRNLLLTLCAVVGAVAPRRAIGWEDGAQIVSAVASLTLLYLSTDALLAVSGNVAETET
jgi:hypothetical protein